MCWRCRKWGGGSLDTPHWQQEGQCSEQNQEPPVSMLVVPVSNAQVHIEAGGVGQTPLLGGGTPYPNNGQND